MWKLGDQILYFTAVEQARGNGNVDWGGSREMEMNQLEISFGDKSDQTWCNELDVV